MNEAIQPRRRNFTYENTLFYLPHQEDRFSPVSAADYFLAKTLSNLKEVNSDKHRKRFADLGCGAGFLGNYIAKNFQSIQGGAMFFCDVYPESIRFAKKAYLENNNIGREKEKLLFLNLITHGHKMLGEHAEVLYFKIGMPLETMAEEKVDFAIASPKYIPEICEDMPVEIFAHFGEVARITGADFYFSHSSLADKVVEAAAQQVGARLVEIRSMTDNLLVRDVNPLKRYGNLLDDETTEKLRALGMVVQGSSESTRYEHDIRVCKFDYKTGRN